MGRRLLKQIWKKKPKICPIQNEKHRLIPRLTSSPKNLVSPTHQTTTSKLPRQSEPLIPSNDNKTAPPFQSNHTDPSIPHHPPRPSTKNTKSPSRHPPPP